MQSKEEKLLRALDTLRTALNKDGSAVSGGLNSFLKLYGFKAPQYISRVLVDRGYVEVHGKGRGTHISYGKLVDSNGVSYVPSVSDAEHILMQASELKNQDQKKTPPANACAMHAIEQDESITFVEVMDDMMKRFNEANELIEEYFHRLHKLQNDKNNIIKAFNLFKELGLIESVPYNNSSDEQNT